MLWSNALVGTLSTIAPLFLLWPLASAVIGWRRTSKTMKAAQAESST
ncbi:hypothetical protein [Roseomonas harenae]|nr:hypothetical protein [Roseomonas harenae]